MRVKDHFIKPSRGDPGGNALGTVVGCKTGAIPAGPVFPAQRGFS